jgi:hypothetical protein
MKTAPLSWFRLQATLEQVPCQRAVIRYRAVQPASMTCVAPVIPPASSEHRKRT